MIRRGGVSHRDSYYLYIAWRSRIVGPLRGVANPLRLNKSRVGSNPTSSALWYMSDLTMSVKLLKSDRFSSIWSKISKAFPFYLIAIFIILSIAFNLTFDIGDQHFWWLADAFLNGNLYLEDIPGYIWFDASFYNGHYYWPLGPFPAVAMIPLVLVDRILGFYLSQGILQLFLIFGVMYFCYKIARIYKFNRYHSIFLGFAFCFASVYVIVAYLPWSWSLSHAIIVFLIFLSLYEYLTKKRYLLIGLYFGFILATRLTAGVGIIFFILAIIFDRVDLNEKLRSLLILLLPFIICGTFLMAYNQARFNSFFDSGYFKVNNMLLNERDRYEMLNHGLFKLSNIPSNFYYYFLKSLDPIRVKAITFGDKNTYVLKFPYVQVDYPGTSFFIVSPIFLFLFRTKFREKIVKLSFFTMFVVLLLVLSWYWPGWRQVGPRYMLDFLPFAFIPLLLAFKNRKLSNGVIALIFISAFIDLYLFISVLGN